MLFVVEIIMGVTHQTGSANVVYALIIAVKPMTVLKDYFVRVLDFLDFSVGLTNVKKHKIK